MLGLIVSIIVIGLIAGALARLVVPGRQDMSILMTIVLGVIGRSSVDSWATCSSTRTPRTDFCSRQASSARSSAR